MRRAPYELLVLDHDDTAVRSTPEIHYPAYRAMLGELRPGATPLSIEGFYLALQRGFREHLRDDLGFSPREVEAEHRIWMRFVLARVPSFHAGLVGILRSFAARGGRVAVVSHSEEAVIRRDWETGAPGIALVAVHGWAEDPGRRKPSPAVLRELLATTGVEARAALVVDDLLPGLAMARDAGVDCAAAGWAHRIPEIERAVRPLCVAYLGSVGELGALLAAEGGEP